MSRRRLAALAVAALLPLAPAGLGAVAHGAPRAASHPADQLIASQPGSVGPGSVGSAPAAPVTDGGRQPIIGGADATDVYPFMASLQEKSGFPFCGGTLIAPTWIITAKHCVQWQKEVHARLGSDDRSDGGEVIDVTDKVLHPDADLALVKLASPASGAPLTVPTTSPAPGAQLRLLGWGMTCTDNTVCSYPRALKQVDVTRADDAACTNGLIHGKEMCLGAQGAGACHGDSGGPALVRQGDGWAVVGATDRLGVHTQTGYCGQSGTIYEDLTAFHDWISQTVGGGPGVGQPGQAVRLTADQTRR